MDFNRMSQGERIAGAGGVALFIFLFLPWFGDVTGWEGQSSTDIYMLITAVVAVATAVTAGKGVDLPGISMNGATMLLGGVATLLLIWLIVFDFPEGQSRGIGIILALVAAVAIAYGGYTAAGGSRGRF
jgi:hypothetical protein